MTLTLDMSPTLINRTAVFNICNDIARIFADVDPWLYYFGVTVKQAPVAAEADTLKGILFQALSMAGEGRFDESRLNFGNVLRPSRKDGERRFFIDPLYILFSDLYPTDVVTVLDVSTVTQPEWHSPAVVALYAKAFEKLCQVQPKVVTISDNTAYTFYANYGFPLDRMRTVHLYSPGHLRDGLGVPPLHAVKPYFLFVGSLEARKNILGAMHAFRCSGLHERGYQLLVVGGRGHGAPEITQLAENTPGVTLYGYASNEDLCSIYAGATGFLYPSYLEGFGVPLLEAMMYGVPSIASTTGACPEVGGPHVAYCDPDDHEGMAEAMLHIAAMDPQARAALATNMRGWVNDRFSFEAFAANIRDAVLG
ncbi:glycosyltransferase family 4 protein [Azospirillum sp. Vi22]|uniref:glycosyltransferase family 4 protein n=1 Tax=Azospirillum baldaniorum TaxID=1064539 RepID=UPI00157AC20C|nr:glycosyltransferase family 1 protein [Azospirillum baldaniorum]NUB08640.1 glycosyltransferase family 4 protein [Azospirillum baldaniorum]